MGRPTKLTPHRTRSILKLLRGGNTMDVAASASGIHPSTLYEWLARGREIHEADEPPTGKIEEDLAELYVDVDQARAAAEAEAITRIRLAGRADWKAEAWWLERSRPQTWGRSTRHEHVGAGGGPVVTASLDIDPSEAAAKAAHEFMTALTAGATDEDADDE